MNIHDLDNDEVNRYIHTEIMGRCWHNFVHNPELIVANCSECGEEKFVPTVFSSDSLNNPDYCSDTSPRWLLDKVKDKLDKRVFTECLSMVTGAVFLSSRLQMQSVLVYANSKQISQACVVAWENMK
jgi:hypothetical protein